MGPEAGAASRLAEMKDRVEKDPKSRLFVQLADEYRKAGQPGEAIAALRRGLEHHPSYVAAWNVLAKLYVESGRDLDAQPVLEKSLSLDPQNVVSARLLGDVHYRRGSLVEAIKKYKLVRAIAPGDTALEELIDLIEAQVGPGQRPEALPAPSAIADLQATQAMVSSRLEPGPESAEPVAEEVRPELAEPAGEEAASRSMVLPAEDESSPFDDSHSSHRAVAPEGTGGFDSDELWHDAAGAEAGAPASPEPAATEVSAAAGESDGEAFRTAYIPNAALLAQMGRPGGDDGAVARASSEPESTAEEPSAIPFGSPPELDVAEPAPSPAEAAGESADDEPVSTLTMADLYLQQGHLVSARGILESLLRRDPTNPEARRRLDEVARLEDDGATPDEVPAGPGGIPGTIALLSKWLEAVKQG